MMTVHTTLVAMLQDTNFQSQSQLKGVTRLIRLTSQVQFIGQVNTSLFCSQSKKKRG